MNEHRQTMTGYLVESLEMIQRVLSEADFEGSLPNIFARSSDDDAEFTARNECGLMLRKAELHIVAALRANSRNNLHSLAVHIRVILECAAHIIGKADAVSDGSPKTHDQILNGLDYDVSSTLFRTSRGAKTSEEVQAVVNEAREATGDRNKKRPKKVSLAAKNKSLLEERTWYDALSEHFIHTSADDLAGPAYTGGLLSSEHIHYELTFENLIDYAAEHAIGMLMANGFLFAMERLDLQPLRDAHNLLERKRGGLPARKGHKNPLGDRPGTLRSADTYPNASKDGTLPSRSNEEILRRRCERCLTFLRTLRSIHSTLDGTPEVSALSATESSLRLRKVGLHVDAITSWGVDLDALHLMGPDIRAATEQLKPLMRRHLDAHQDDVLQRTARRVSSRLEAELAPFSHPTPMTLLSATHDGGFSKTGNILTLYQLYSWLSQLVDYYGTGLEEIAAIFDPHRQAQIRRVMALSSADLRSLPLKEVLRS